MLRVHRVAVLNGMERPHDPPLPDPFVGICGIDDNALTNIAESRECACCGAKGEKLRQGAMCHSKSVFLHTLWQVL